MGLRRNATSIGRIGEVSIIHGIPETPAKGIGCGIGVCSNIDKIADLAGIEDDDVIDEVAVTAWSA